jgi:hypothetical protein
MKTLKDAWNCKKDEPVDMLLQQPLQRINRVPNICCQLATRAKMSG